MLGYFFVGYKNSPAYGICEKRIKIIKKRKPLSYIEYIIIIIIMKGCAEDEKNKNFSSLRCY